MLTPQEHRMDMHQTEHEADIETSSMLIQNFVGPRRCFERHAYNTAGYCGLQFICYIILYMMAILTL